MRSATKEAKSAVASAPAPKGNPAPKGAKTKKKTSKQPPGAAPPPPTDEELAAAERADRDLKLAEQEGRRRDAIDRESRVIDQEGEVTR